MREARSLKESKCFLNMHKLFEAAIADYGMIMPGDHVIAGLSGGKDSSMLLRLLARKKVRTTNDFRLSAAFIKMGFSNEESVCEALKNMCEGLNVPFFTIQKSLTELMEREKKQPCYLCSRTRRLAIFDLADEIGANVIAFGHHRDDFIQTFMMNLFCNGSIEAMKPNNPFFDGKYRIIRPMVYIKESSIAAETQNSGIQPLDTGCSFSHVSERHFIREKLKEIYAHNPKMRNNIFKALYTPKTDFLLKNPSVDVLD